MVNSDPSTWSNNIKGMIKGMIHMAEKRTHDHGRSINPSSPIFDSKSPAIYGQTHVVSHQNPSKSAAESQPPTAPRQRRSNKPRHGAQRFVGGKNRCRSLILHGLPYHLYMHHRSIKRTCHRIIT